MSDPRDVDLTWARTIYRYQSLDRQLRATIVLSGALESTAAVKQALRDLRDAQPDEYALLLEHVEIPHSWLPD